MSIKKGFNAFLTAFTLWEIAIFAYAFSVCKIPRDWK